GDEPFISTATNIVPKIIKSGNSQINFFMGEVCPKTLQDRKPVHHSLKSPLVTGKSSLRVSAKPDRATATSQRLIAKGAQSGSQTLTAATASGSWCGQMRT